MSQEPRSLKTANEAIDYLYELRLFGTKLGLENPRRLAAYFGNPQDELKLIHVAGTNGKGSVCAMLESIYRAEGYRVGLFTSPHLIHFGERVQVNRRLLPDDRLVALVNEIRNALRTFPTEHHPTFFEIVVILALLHFREQGCEVVIWETGMGGRLDATNIVTPLLSIITNVALDHQKWLGDTLGAIAYEKAGIIKPGVPVVHGVADGEPARVVNERALELGSSIHLVDQETVESTMGGIDVGLSGKHQITNGAIAMNAVEVLVRDIPVSPVARAQGLTNVEWAGRLQQIRRKNQVILLDGSHNGPSIDALCAYLEEHFTGVPKAFLMGVLEDKEVDQWLPQLVSQAERFYLTPVGSGRTLSTSDLASRLKGIKADVRIDRYEGLEEALVAAIDQPPLLVVCGSIYLVGEALGILTDNRSAKNQSSLNDWGSDPIQDR
jgi:dihydrofolate synthase / folylpolyglutamate synthase